MQDVAELLRIPFAYAAKVIYSLHKAGLVDRCAGCENGCRSCAAGAIKSGDRYLDRSDRARWRRLVLRDQIEALGESPDSLPESKLDELITLIGREISDGKLKNKFEESMFQEISNFKRF